LIRAAASTLALAIEIKPMSESDHDAMVRWQGYSREQRSTVNSLFLTYAAALLGLQSSIILTKEVTTVYWPKFFVTAGGTALLSLTAGCVVVLVRLRDARLTARIARFRVEQKSPSDIDLLRNSTKRLGMWTNVLIPVQVTTFALAAVAFLIWVVLSFGAKFSTAAG
jgi:hypothetical protein